MQVIGDSLMPAKPQESHPQQAATGKIIKGGTKKKRVALADQVIMQNEYLGSQ
jgi:hypothetical protein